MRILEHCGFIAIQQGFKVGPFIAHTILNRMAGLLLNAVSFRNVSIGELTKARFDIENVMLRHVIDRANDSGIKSSEKIFRSRKGNWNTILYHLKKTWRFINRWPELPKTTYSSFHRISSPTHEFFRQSIKKRNFLSPAGKGSRFAPQSPMQRRKRVNHNYKRSWACSCCNCLESRLAHSWSAWFGPSELMYTGDFARVDGEYGLTKVIKHA